MLVNNSKQYKHVFECDDMLKSASAMITMLTHLQGLRMVQTCNMHQ